MLEIPEEINELSINKDFWIQIKPDERISFRASTFPDGLHLTIAFNKTSKYLNVHISKNTRDGTNKPKIELFRILKKDLNQLVEPLVFNGFYSQFEYFDIFIKDFRNGWFLPFDKLTNEEDAVKLLKQFEENTSIKKRKKVKVKGEIIKKLESYSKEESIKKDYFSKFKKFCPLHDTAGFLFLGEEKISLQKINNRWYFNRHDHPIDILKKTFGIELVDHLVDYTNRSLAIIVDLDNYEESKKFNNSLLFYWCSVDNSLKYITKDNPTISIN